MLLFIKLPFFIQLDILVHGDHTFDFFLNFFFTNMFSHLEQSYTWLWSALADHAECAAIQTGG